MRQYINRSWLIPFAVFIIALLLRLIPLLYQPFDGLYGQDAYAYFDFAAAIRNMLLTGESPGTFFWGLGYPTMLAGLFIVSGGAAAGIAQAASILMGAAIPAIISVIALKLSLRPIGALTAGLILAACGQAIQSSLVVMADIPALFWSVCAALLLLIYSESRKPLPLIACALCLTMAILSRWLYGVLLLPFFGYWLAIRQPFRHLMYALAAASILVLPQAIFSLNNPFPVFNHAWVTGWTPINAVAQDFINVDGEFHYAQPNFLFYSAPLIDPYYFAPALLPFTLLGIFSLRRRNSLFWYGWLLLPLIFLIGIPYQNIRFPLIAMPAVALLTGAGISKIFSVFKGSRLYPVRGVLTCAAVCLALVWVIQAAEPTIDAFLQIQDESKQSALWASRIANPDATIYAFGITLTLEHYANQQVEELYYFTPEQLEAQIQPGDYLLVNVWQLENQWAGQPVYDSFNYLRYNRGLYQIGRHGLYTLYVIR